MRSLLRSRHLVLAAVSTGLLALAVAEPDLLGRRRRRTRCTGSRRRSRSGCGRRRARSSRCTSRAASRGGRRSVPAGRSTRRRDAVARYSVGSGLNAVAPAHLGSAARIVLFARVVEGEGGIWRVGGAGAAVGAVRVHVAGGRRRGRRRFSARSRSGPWPPWPAWWPSRPCVALCSRRIRCERRVGHVLDAFRELGRTPPLAPRRGGADRRRHGGEAGGGGRRRRRSRRRAAAPRRARARPRRRARGRDARDPGQRRRGERRRGAGALGRPGWTPRRRSPSGIAFGAVETLAAIAVGARAACA